MELFGEQEKFFDQVSQQRNLEIKHRGLRFQFYKGEYRLLFPNHEDKADTISKLQVMLNSKDLLGIYKIDTGRRKAKVQSVYFKLDRQDHSIFRNNSYQTFDIYFGDGDVYILDYYRYAPEQVYLDAISQSRRHFVPHETPRSLKIHNYLIGLTKQVKVDKQYEFEPGYRFLNKKRILSTMQKKAIRKAGKCGVFILMGGAGTGKTLTACLIAIEYSLVKKNVIMTAVTDTGSKQLALRCTEELDCYEDQSQILDIIEKIRSMTQIQDVTLFLDQEQRQELKASQDEKLVQLIKEYEEKRIKSGMKFLFFNSLVTLEQYFRMPSILRAYSFNTRVIFNFLKLTNYSWSFKKVLETINSISEKILVDKQSKQLYIKAVNQTVYESNIVVTNTSKAAEINIHQPQGMEFKPHIAIFDEAAQSKIPDAYCVLSLDVERLILIGDQQQMTPQIRGNHELLGISILSLLQSREKNIMVFREQWRMSPDIAELVSYLRYGGKLRNGFKQKNQLKQLKGIFTHPISMCTHNYAETLTTGCNRKGYFNLYQAVLIKLYIEMLPRQMLPKVGIITIYKAQVQLLKKILAEQVKLGLDISTVDYFQGGEKDYIFASIVRCNNYGAIKFAENKSRITVLLSRAKKGLVIVGSQLTLTKGSNDNPWKDVVHYLRHKHAIYYSNYEQDQRVMDRYDQILAKEEGTNNQNAERTFDTETFEATEEFNSISSISSVQIAYETAELPFIRSNYN